MNRKIVTWVATGAVVLGIGAAGVGAVVANSNAAAKSSAPVAAAAATTTVPTTTSTAGSTQGGAAAAMPAQMGQSDEGQSQKLSTGAAQAGALQNGGDNASMTGAAAGQTRGG